jgi:HEAT repeat protein
VDPLLGALNDKDTFVRNFACTSLGNLGDPRAVAPLVKALGDESLVVRRSAAEALGNLGDKRAVDPLIKALSDERDLVRRSAAQALGALGDPKAIDPLLEALRDEDIYIWNGASIALTAIGNACVPDLVKALGDWILGPRAASILKDLGWQPSSDKERILFYVATRNRQALLQNWDIARKILVSEANHGSKRQAENAVCALIGIGREESLEDLAETIKVKGSTEMAAAFLKSGNTYLAEVARNWANANGGEIKAGSGGGPILWGRLESF